MADFKDLDALLQDFVDGGLPGCAMQIAQAGKTIYEGYFGCADIDKKKPVTASSLFRMASMSKLPLYTTCMMLFEQGKFLLSDPLYNWFPEWKNVKKYQRTPTGQIQAVPIEGAVTVRDALSMKCGLPYCNSPGETNNQTLAAMQRCMKPLWEKGHYTLREHIKAMSQAPLAFEPGAHWLYGFSSELAAGLIEAVCDKPIDDVFQEMLFDPLGMGSTRSHFFGDIPGRMVTLYARKEDGTLSKASTALDRKFLPGQENEAGWSRLFSNVNDFTKLMSMLANGGVYDGKRIMGFKTIDMMRSNGLNEIHQKDFDEDQSIYNMGYGYGYGVRTVIDRQKGNIIASNGAFGWTGGFGTWCEADPAEGLSIVYMHNMMPNMERYYHLRMRSVAYGCVE
jgi:CubicO group peptidase (beta-lactamase class C family)